MFTSNFREKTHVKGHVYAYLDKKNQPNKKLAYLFDMKSDDGKNPIVQEFSLNSKLSAPGLPKDLSVDYKFNRDFNKDFGNFLLVIDVFANPNQKLVIDCKTKYTKDEKNGYGYNAMMTAKSAVSIFAFSPRIFNNSCKICTYEFVCLLIFLRSLNFTGIRNRLYRNRRILFETGGKIARFEEHCRIYERRQKILEWRCLLRKSTRS